MRRLLPAKPWDEVEWELVSDGQIIGVIKQVKLGRGGGTFFHAYAYHPETCELVDLQLSPDKAERVKAVKDFREDPNATRGIHWH